MKTSGQRVGPQKSFVGRYVPLRAESGDRTWPPTAVDHVSFTASEEEVSVTHSTHTSCGASYIF